MCAGLTTRKNPSDNGACRQASMVILRLKSVMSGPSREVVLDRHTSVESSVASTVVAEQADGVEDEQSPYFTDQHKNVTVWGWTSRAWNCPTRTRLIGMSCGSSWPPS